MRKELLDGEQIFVIHDFLSPTECNRYIRLTEAKGYDAAPVTTAFGPVMMPDVRNNERVIVDDFAWASDIWARAQELIPSPFEGFPVVGLNERFRFYRYDPGQTFAPHRDGAFARDNELSRLTFMVYLNGDCEGGETVFYFGDGEGVNFEISNVLRVKPETGKALVFQHRLLHEGAAVAKGRKYVLRTDVMYRWPL